MTIRPFLVAALLTQASPALALNILLSNDDGLTSNVKAQYEALKADGHDVLVSVPCTNQSGRGTALAMYSASTIVADNDKTSLDAGQGCRNGVATFGDPAVGPFKRAGFTGGDYYYVHGTPGMATMYGLDVLAPMRWGKAPDLVLSGPNEGQNVGRIGIASGTLGNAQLAALRGVPAIALSAGYDTADDVNLANPNSAIVAQLTLKLVKALQARSGGGPLLPLGIALNVNFPNAPTAALQWGFARIGSFELYNVRFKTMAPYGFSLTQNSTSSATAEQAEDEAVVYSTKVSVAAMQVGYEYRPTGQQWLRLRLRDLFK